jgi:AraC-like DNA-binding protein
MVDRTDDAQYYVAVFKPSLINRSCHGAIYEGLKHKRSREGGVLHSISEPSVFDLLRRTMDSLMEESLDPDILNHEGGFGVESTFTFEHGDPDSLNAGLHHLLLLSWRSHQKGSARCREISLHPAVCKALQLLSEEELTLGLAALAKRCGMSPAYLSRVFVRQVGVPLNRYRNGVRLSRFLELWRLPKQKTITEAAYDSGFGSYAQFYKVFSQAYGCGPRGVLHKSRTN